MDFFFKYLFPIFFALIFFVVIGVFSTVAYLGYQCYASNDPNSMACFMTSQRIELGVRDR